MVIHQITNSYGNYNYNAYIYDKVFFESHFHGNYELIYSIKGNTEVTINDVKCIISQGELILVSPYTIHALKGEVGSRVWVGVFSEDYISSFVEKNRFVSFLSFKCEPKIEKILVEQLFFEGKPEQYLLTACLYLVCNECAKKVTSCNSKKDEKFMLAVIEYISENLSQDKSLKEVASELNYEYHYFSSLFHRHFAMNFKSFVNIFRFEFACKLLMNTDASITVICEKCGFGSIRNFNRVFKQLSGITPGQYRKGE